MRRIRDEQGASAVEFAIISSVLLLLLFGTITFGIAFNRSQGLHASGREGARLGALSGTTRQEIVNRVGASLSIISPANIEADCPTNPPTLALEKGCIDVFVRHAASSTCPGSGCTEFTTATSTPCGSAPQTASEPAVVVEVFYRMRIDIPIFSAPQMTVKGLGEFRCEV